MEKMQCEDVRQTPVHMDAFSNALTQKRFLHKSPLHTHRRIYTQKLFTHTQLLLHMDALTNRAFTHRRTFTL